MSTETEVSKSKRISYYLKSLKEKDRRCANDYEAYLHLETSLYEIELEHVSSVTGIMRMVPFRNFKFFAECNANVWASVAHAIIINCNGAYGIYEGRTFPEECDFLSRDYFNPTFYRLQDPLVFFPSKLGKGLYAR